MVTEIASDGYYSTGIYAGRPTRIIPVSGIQTEGFIPGQLPAAQHMNYLLGEYGEQINFLTDGYNTLNVDLPNRVDVLENYAANATLAFRPGWGVANLVGAFTFSPDDWITFSSTELSGAPNTIITSSSHSGTPDGDFLQIGGGTTDTLGAWEVSILAHCTSPGNSGDPGSGRLKVYLHNNTDPTAGTTNVIMDLTANKYATSDDTGFVIVGSTIFNLTTFSPSWKISLRNGPGSNINFSTIFTSQITLKQLERRWASII